MFKLSRRVKYSYEAVRIKTNKFRGGKAAGNFLGEIIRLERVKKFISNAMMSQMGCFQFHFDPKII